MHTLGIIIKNPGVSQQTLLTIQSMNALVKSTPYVSPIVFYEGYGPIILPPQFAWMQQIEAYAFDGPLFATSLETAQIAINCPRASKRYFYVWDLEWIFNPSIPYNILQNLYHNDDMELIARSLTHADTLTKCWKKPVAIIEDMNPQQIMDLIS